MRVACANGPLKADEEDGTPKGEDAVLYEGDSWSTAMEPKVVRWGRFRAGNRGCCEKAAKREGGEFQSRASRLNESVEVARPF